jgi:hypothetical protein
MMGSLEAAVADLESLDDSETEWYQPCTSACPTEGHTETRIRLSFDQLNAAQNFVKPWISLQKSNAALVVVHFELFECVVEWVDEWAAEWVG